MQSYNYGAFRIDQPYEKSDNYKQSGRFSESDFDGDVTALTRVAES
jgi:hypothetical protein